MLTLNEFGTQKKIKHPQERRLFQISFHALQMKRFAWNLSCLGSMVVPAGDRDQES